MKVYTITCHDVYNAGASLQAYALNAYLKKLGHIAEIIDYKPDYLSMHYSLTTISEKYDKPLIRFIYYAVKFPGRIKNKYGKKKKRFDNFKSEYLTVTNHRYKSCAEMAESLPESDVYIAGSDQIWNPLFQNGKDDAFFLQFAPKDKIKASYAASFAVETLPHYLEDKIADNIKNLNKISVREDHGVEILHKLGIESCVSVVDPVFLLDKEDWERCFIKRENVYGRYILIYDFDNSIEIKDLALKIARERGCRILTIQNMDYGRLVKGVGPIEFLNLIYHSEFIISNSFHATAFSLIFNKEFIVAKRKESINTRMEYLLKLCGLEERLIENEMNDLCPIDYKRVQGNIVKKIQYSKEYLDSVLI
ncbi:MAG: polysaccharide pyruvyl transferase family protein [Bacillota bacterium]